MSMVRQWARNFWSSDLMAQFVSNIEKGHANMITQSLALIQKQKTNGYISQQNKLAHAESHSNGGTSFISESRTCVKKAKPPAKAVHCDQKFKSGVPHVSQVFGKLKKATRRLPSLCNARSCADSRRKCFTGYVRGTSQQICWIWATCRLLHVPRFVSPLQTE